MWSVRVVAAAAAVFFSDTCDKWQQLGREKQTDSTVQTNKEMQQRLCVLVSVCVCVCATCNGEETATKRKTLCKTLRSIGGLRARSGKSKSESERGKGKRDT